MVAYAPIFIPAVGFVSAAGAGIAKIPPYHLNYAQEGVDQQTLRKRNLLGTLEILL
jgi:hypothetical protein